MSKLNRWMRACGVSLLWATTAVALPAQTFTTLHSFNGTDGANPYPVPFQGTSGNLYGTTSSGGATGYGTVFTITINGTLTTLHSFNSTDGAYPYAGLIQATNGNFYGTTYGGANSSCSGGLGCGTVFKITPGGTLTTLHSFDGTDGANPEAGLVQGTDGNFYGTTYFGGANCPVYGCGTVFKITPSGALTTLHSFDSTDGANPRAGLVQATNGKFYGTTYGGGANDYGTVFKITPGGTLVTLHSFNPNGLDGAYPEAALVQGANGNLYGTTDGGGANGPVGTVFKITPSGTLTILHSFCSQTNCTDGDSPAASLVQATDGNFYGTTEHGGANNQGTLFKITSSGALTTSYSFCSQGGNNCTDGSQPVAGLVQDTNGTFYGTTDGGGANGPNGTVFSLSVGLGPFVATNPTTGPVGKSVKILGTSLTGSTSVTFNGTAATFTVVSASEITTKVPTGATTGTVQVATPGGTLSSNVPFTVN
jgi:uncharacterized repeat protein (TIGR03803 family)